MAVIPNAARVPKRWKLEVAIAEGSPDEYQGHTSAIEWPSSQTPYTWRGGDGNTLTDIADADQLCNITVAQDLTAGSLYRVMRENAGATAVLTYWPEYDVEDFAVQATITLMRPPLKTDRAGQIIEHVVGCPSTVPVDFTPTP